MALRASSVSGGRVIALVNHPRMGVGDCFCLRIKGFERTLQCG